MQENNRTTNRSTLVDMVTAHLKQLGAQKSMLANVPSNIRLAVIDLQADHVLPALTVTQKAIEDKQEHLDGDGNPLYVFTLLPADFRRLDNRDGLVVGSDGSYKFLEYSYFMEKIRNPEDLKYGKYFTVHTLVTKDSGEQNRLILAPYPTNNTDLTYTYHVDGINTPIEGIFEDYYHVILTHVMSQLNLRSSQNLDDAILKAKRLSIDPVLQGQQNQSTVRTKSSYFGGKAVNRSQDGVAGAALPYFTGGAPGAAGNGIASVTLVSTVGLVKTYRITFTDATTFDYTVTDGVVGTDGNGIASVTLVSTVGLVKTYRITFTDATTFDYTVSDGADGGGGSLEQTQAVYVSKVGNDTNSGIESIKPLLTFSAAITKASELIVAGATGVRIEVQDGGTYTEATEIEVPENVHISASSATFIGEVRISANASFTINRHFASDNNSIMAQHAGGADGAAIYIANICDGRGVNGALTGSRNIRNVGGGGKNFFVRTGIMYVSASGIGIGDVSSGNAGHIHFLAPDLYLAGNNAVGILGSAQGAGSSNIIGFSDHILEIGSPTGTVGIQMSSAGAAVKVVVAEIIADTAYNITAGDLYLSCPKITGTRIGTPANLMLGSADGVSGSFTAGSGETITVVNGLITSIV